MDKTALVAQLQAKIRDQLLVVRRAEGDAREGARDLATEQEKREDSRYALEFGALAAGHDKRMRQLSEDRDALDNLRLRPFKKTDAIGLGALVEIEDEEGREGRTFLVLPVGAGSELTGPDGDGLISVVTPASPIGRAVMGKRLGDDLEVMLQGEPRAYTIVWVE
jgi:transcription elongation GreA/GreB family factor